MRESPADELIGLASGTRPAGLPIEYRPVFREDAAHRPLPKVAERVASRIVEDLLDEGLQVGNRLPSEAEMQERYQVSRDTVREAQRLLEVQGVIQLRRGPGGGPFLRPVNAAYLARSASLYFRLAGATWAEVFDTWLTLEPLLAARAARLENRDAVRRAMTPFLEANHAIPTDGGTFFTSANGFHDVLSQLMPNRVTAMLTQAVEHLVAEHVTEDLDPVAARLTIVSDHHAIATAIIAGHHRRAEELAAQHICHVRDHYRAGWPAQMDAVVNWR